MLFLNSLGFSSQMWDYQITAFAEQGFRCIGFDRRGHGRSDQPARGYDYDTFTDDIATLIDKLDLSGLTLVSHSMAGGEIVRYLSRHGSSRIARIVMLGSMTPKLLQSEDNPNGIPRVEFEELWAQWRRDYPKWVDDATAPFFIPETSRGMMRWAVQVLQSPWLVEKRWLKRTFAMRCDESRSLHCSSMATATARRRSSRPVCRRPSSFRAVDFSSTGARRMV